MMSFYGTRRRQARNAIWQTVVLTAMMLGMLSSQAIAGETQATYGGHYELADAKAGRTFSLDVRQTRSRADISFSAAMADGSGAVPDGTGKGEVDDGVLSFKFKDSFKNEGTCTLMPKKGVYRLSMTVIKVVDPSPLHFYGDILLKRVIEQLSH